MRVLSDLKGSDPVKKTNQAIVSEAYLHHRMRIRKNVLCVKEQDLVEE